MNILVIGNGFDLAHELPTKYTHFLEFCKRVFPIYENAEGRSINLYQQDFLFNWDFNKEIKETLENAYKSRKKIVVAKNQSQIQTAFSRLNEMYSIIKDNIWIEYFLQCNMYQKENWIDFEKEISNVIHSLDGDMHELDRTIDDFIMNLSNKFLYQIYSKYTYAMRSMNALTSGKCESITFKEIRNRLLNDLNKLIRALEIYLTEYVNKIKCSKESLDIREIFEKRDEQGNIKSFISTKILNFNYTDTFKKVYKIDFDIDFIHGKADINNTIDTNNMVLGIDEYLPDDRKDKDVEFIAFKKFYQRIYKQTGCKYKEWVDEIRQDYIKYLQKLENADYMEQRYIPDDMQRMINEIAISAIKGEKCPIHNLYIFGHSLDVTDKDILRDLILNDNVHTTIFYHNKDAMGQQIANLVKVIGQDELIRRTGGSTRAIEFVPQKPMRSMPINEQESI